MFCLTGCYCSKPTLTGRVNSHLPSPPLTATVFGVKPEYFSTDIIMSFQWHRKSGSEEGFTRGGVWIYHLPRKRILCITGVAGKTPQRCLWVQQWCSSGRSKVSDSRFIQGSGDVTQLPAEVNRDKVDAKVMDQRRNRIVERILCGCCGLGKPGLIMEHYLTQNTKPEIDCCTATTGWYWVLGKDPFLCFWFSCCRSGSWSSHVVAASLKESSSRSLGKKLAKYSQLQYARHAYLEGLGLTVPLKLQIKVMRALPGCDSYRSMHLIWFSLFLLNP